MDELERFRSLFFSHKHLWIELQEAQHLNRFPDDDPEEVHGRFVDAAYDTYHPLEDILLQRLPTQDELETILLAARRTVAAKKGV